MHWSFSPLLTLDSSSSCLCSDYFCSCLLHERTQISSKECRWVQAGAASPEIPKLSITHEGQGETQHLLSDFLGMALDLESLWSAWNPNDTEAPWAWIWSCMERGAPHTEPVAWQPSACWAVRAANKLARAYLTGGNGLVAMEKLNCLFAYKLLYELIKKCQAVSRWQSFPLSALKPPGGKIKNLSILYSLLDIKHHTRPTFKEPLQPGDPLQAQDSSISSEQKAKESPGQVPQMLSHVWNGWAALVLGCLILIFSKKKRLWFLKEDNTQCVRSQISTQLYAAPTVVGGMGDREGQCMYSLETSWKDIIWKRERCILGCFKSQNQGREVTKGKFYLIINKFFLSFFYCGKMHTT